MAGPVRTGLSRLQLTDFRNWPQFQIESDGRHVVLIGENGAGKTNILEAISFLSPGRGMRRAAYDTIARIGGTGSWSVHARAQGANGEVSIGTGIRAEGGTAESGRRIRIDGSTAKSSDILLEHLRIVWLTPSMDSLFTGPAADRRRFLDRLVLAIDPQHGRRVAAYERAMRSRARLLSEPDPDSAFLDALEAQLAEAGTAITMARLELIALLDRSAADNRLPASAFPEFGLTLESEMAQLATTGAASDVEDRLLAQIRSARRQDAASGRTAFGPHRCDLAVVHQPKTMPAAQCSTGEQKALLIGIVLAHAGLVAAMSGFAPILLLDEIAAHLDSARRAALYDRLELLNCQAWMTGTDAALFESLGERAAIWHLTGEGLVMESRQ